MAANLTDEQILEEARKRVKAKKAFFIHVLTYIAVNAVLVLIWFLSGGSDTYSGDWTGGKWFLWPLTIWGVFVVVEGFRVFVIDRKPDVNEVQKEADRIKKSQG